MTNLNLRPNWTYNLDRIPDQVSRLPNLGKIRQETSSASEAGAGDTAQPIDLLISDDQTDVEKAYVTAVFQAESHRNLITAITLGVAIIGVAIASLATVSASLVIWLVTIGGLLILLVVSAFLGSRAAVWAAWAKALEMHLNGTSATTLAPDRSK